MHAALSAVFATGDAADWEQRLSNAGIPCGMVRRVDEAGTLAGEGALLDVEIPGLPQENVQIPGPGYRVAGQAAPVLAAPPRLDADRAEIIAWLAQDAVA